ncbi:unnamed protein product [Pelagomonas calceolata]|uniref:RING-type domain-containing protein n=1 Tax=Pelagomonas calceolata TaxID=35677 RepID=A0A8J2SG88_9STRA|nr:unnamed protein product [Pelagomonas calceolata]
MSDQLDKLCAAIAQAEARAPPPMAANDAIRLYVDLCQVVDPIKRNGLRTLLQELTAKKTAREIPSVTQAFLERAPALVGAVLWRQCCEKQRPRGDPVPGPAAAGGGEDASPPGSSSDAPWRCNWCQSLKADGRCRGPGGPSTLCGTCYRRHRNGETGPRSADWSCDRCGVQETPRRFKGPKGPATLCEPCGLRYVKGATGPPAEDWRCDWCPETTGRRCTGPKGPGTLCKTCGGRFRNGKTGPLSATFECRWCGATSTRRRYDGPTGEGELCVSCGTYYANASDKIKARLGHVEKELVNRASEVERLTSELDRLTSVPVIDAETGAETRERPPKRAREDADAAPPPSGLQREKAQRDAFRQVKLEKEALEDRLLCTICMEADAPRTVLFGPCNHFLACASCADALQECPNCRVPIAARTSIANTS